MKRFIYLVIFAGLLHGAAIASNPLGAIGNLLGISNDKDSLDVASLEGTSWKYTSPAVSFESENALSQIGGAAAASTIESKMSPYYKKLGLNTLTISFEADNKFTMTIKKYTLTGTVTTGSDGAVVFNFKKDNLISLGSVNGRMTVSGNTMSLTFDATRVISIVKTVAQYSNNSSLNTLSSLLNNYQNIYAGAKLTKAK